SHEWKKLNDAFIYENLQSISEEFLWKENVDIRQWIEDERILLGSHQSNMLAPSEKLIVEFHKVWKSLGGAQSYRFRC
ncbi:8071_t:CDS:1, partial [Funneliformis geosporum]